MMSQKSMNMVRLEWLNNINYDNSVHIFAGHTVCNVKY